MAKKTRVAVEITETGVRAIEATIGRNPTIVTAGEVPLPDGAAKDSEIIDRAAVAMALQRLWADARISSRDVVLGVGNRRILVREHSTQLTNPDHIRQSLPFEVQDRLPVPVDQAVLDFVPTRQDQHGVHGLLVAAVAEHMEELVGALGAAKLRVTSIDLLAFGYARALAALTAPGETGLILGIGAHTTHIVIATGGIPRFVRVVPIDIVPPPGEPAVTWDAAPTETPTQLAPQSRRELRIGGADATVAVLDAPAAPAPTGRLHPDVQAALIDLVGRLRGTVGFYRDRVDAVGIDRAFLTGVHAGHDRLRDAVGRVTETPVTVVGATDLIAAPRAFTLPAEVDVRLAGVASLLRGASAMPRGRAGGAR
ncbi:pilus assembly protein PilM [Microbacterium sp.]|uniref:pilus assembly protein PilM n=1 Tax=Microbacterium sp. TaxID=51671 RepID=UPI003736F1FA